MTDLREGPLNEDCRDAYWIIVGQFSGIRQLAIALLARGHVILEEVLGTGKT
jgi:MoxR-like ATPase